MPEPRTMTDELRDLHEQLSQMIKELREQQSEAPDCSRQVLSLSMGLLAGSLFWPPLWWWLFGWGE